MDGTSSQFEHKVRACGIDPVPLEITTLQLNITRMCNQTCTHCHVDASPRRREMLSEDAISDIFRILRDNPKIVNVDLTGGAPELHPMFRKLVEGILLAGRKVLVRHNLTVTLDPHPETGESLEYLPQFFAEHRVEVVSSLPFYQEFFTDKQRGHGVFEKSIESLRRLNKVGYGKSGSGLILNLVYNPVGPFLPPAQAALEGDYKRALLDKFGIQFNHLFALTNVPLKRFKANLVKTKKYDEYMAKLETAFNPGAVPGIMCRSQINVGYDGTLYDCDFNQMEGLPIETADGPLSLKSWNRDLLEQRSIRFGSHCFACTAGTGSSCGGATTT
jgi:radical SAM/Cys-rich protein